MINVLIKVFVCCVVVINSNVLVCICGEIFIVFFVIIIKWVMLFIWLVIFDLILFKL